MDEDQIRLLINNAESWMPEEPVWFLLLPPAMWDLVKTDYYELFDVQMDESMVVY